jgi:hypothetical protein
MDEERALDAVADHFSENAWRDAYGLILAFWRDDYPGQDAILANADMKDVACAAVAFAVGVLTFTGQQLGHADPGDLAAFIEAGLSGALQAALDEPEIPGHGR